MKYHALHSFLAVGLLSTAACTGLIHNTHYIPTAVPIEDQVVAVNSSTGALPFQIDDYDDLESDIAINALSSDLSLIPIENIVLSGSGAQRSVTVTPTLGQSGGPVLITIVMSDGQNVGTLEFDVSVAIVPSGLSYTRSSRVLSTQGPRLGFIPTVTGTFLSYSVSPALPAGLTINSSSGIISGKPTEISSETDYTVTAANVSGSTSFQMSLEILDAIYVDTDSDVADAAVNGICASASGACSLRAAISEADALSGTQTVLIPADRNIILSSEIVIGESISIVGEDAEDSVVSGGGATRVFKFSPTSHTSQFKRFTIRDSNNAGAAGGAIYSVGGDITVSEMNFISNKNISAPLYGGGAISTDDNGGAAPGSLTVLDSNFEGNQSAGIVGQGGGAILFNGTTLEVRRSSFSTNASDYFSGAILSFDADVVISDSMFDGNLALSGGGAVLFLGGDVDVINSTFSTNFSANAAGAIGTVTAGAVYIAHNTFSGNSSITFGGVLFTTQGTATLANNLFQANTSASGRECATIATITSSGGNLTNNSAVNSGCGFNGGVGDIVSTSVALGALADNGGPTLTMKFTAGAAAAAVDAGRLAHCQTYDARGISRLTDGACDIGAYEETL